MGIGFTRESLEYLTSLPVNQGFLWQRDGKAQLVIKLHNMVNFSSYTLLAEMPQKLAPNSTTFSFHLSLQRGWHKLSIHCLINPAPLYDLQIFHVLSSSQQIEVYAVTPDLRYLGTQFLSWSGKKKRYMRVFVQYLSQQEKQANVIEEETKAPEKQIEVGGPQQRPVAVNNSSLLAKYWQTLLQDCQNTFPSEGQIDEEIWRGRTLVSAFEDAHKIRLSIEQRRRLSQLMGLPISLTVNFPNRPFWIECFASIAGYSRKPFGILCFRDSDYEEYQMMARGGMSTYYRDYVQLVQWRLDFVDEQGSAFLRLRSKSASIPYHWEVDRSHRCPTRACPSSTSSRLSLQDMCPNCQYEADIWLHSCNALLVVALRLPVIHEQETPIGPHPNPQSRPPTTSAPEVSLRPSPPAQEISKHPLQPVIIPSRPELKPVIVSHPLLIDRYIQRQKNLEKQGAVDRSQKYLWMHSAWVMAEALSRTAEHDGSLRPPTDHVYIELEQPRLLQGIAFAACSFLCLASNEYSRQQWQYTLIDGEGKTSWSLFYEYDPETHCGTWNVPQGYICPQAQCQIEETPKGKLYDLCTQCQERIEHSTSWVTVALRMICGYYREQVELREPEEVLETSPRTETDETTGETKKRTSLHRFRVIRSYDACTYRGKEAQTKRGSWMTGKPLAESEYDLNPNAIIYVQIQPSEHDRTYRHDRYIHMKGKTQHIDPKPRLQAMTIAHYRQLPKLQRITRVYASKFEV